MPWELHGVDCFGSAHGAPVIAQRVIGSRIAWVTQRIFKDPGHSHVVVNSTVDGSVCQKMDNTIVFGTGNNPPDPVAVLDMRYWDVNTMFFPPKGVFDIPADCSQQSAFPDASDF